MERTDGNQYRYRTGKIFLLTPLQIANLGATIANRGHFITPHVVKEIEDNELDSIYRTARVTTIDREYYDEWWWKACVPLLTGSTGSATCRMVGSNPAGCRGLRQNRYGTKSR